MRVIFSILLLLFFSNSYSNTETISFNSNIESTKNNTLAPSQSSNVKSKTRKRIIKGGEHKYECSFSYYTSGRISKQDGEKITYSDTKIVFGNDVYYLNNGLISEFSNEDGRYFFKYDNDKLISITKKFLKLDHIKEYIEFTWDNDVIVHQLEWRSNHLIRDYYYEYDTHEDYGGVCAFLQSDSTLFDDWPEALLIQGYFGKLPKYLVSKATDILPNGFGMNTFDYRLDSDGYPTYMSWTLKDGRSFPFYFTWETLPPIPAESISLSVESWNGKIGDSFTLAATVVPEDNDDSLRWESSDPSISNVDSNGTVTAISVGEATITAICGDVSASCKVTVLPTPIESITLTPESWSGKIGESISLSAMVNPENATDKSLSWLSCDETIATVDPNGLVKAINTGKVDIIAKTNDGSDIKAICHVEVSPVLIESISLKPYNLSCSPGESFTIQASILPSNATNINLEWSSSDESIANVDQEGNVTTVNAGNVLITAKALDGSEIGAVCNVIVNPILANSINLSLDNWTSYVGETLKLTVYILPENVTDKTTVWSSNNEEVVTVDSDGNVKALAVGDAVITASCWNVSATCNVIVQPTLAESITLSLDNWTAYEDETIQLTATVLPDNTTDKMVVWSSSDESVATVDADGKVTAVSIGETFITASCGNASATCAVTVLPIHAETLIIDPIVWSGEEGTEFTIKAIILPENTTNKELYFESSDTEIATVDNDGHVYVLKEGSCTIVVSTTDGSNLKAECEITSLSGIELIFTDSDADVNVYDLNGIMLKHVCSRDQVKHLTSGVYVLRNGTTVVKLVIR